MARGAIGPGIGREHLERVFEPFHTTKTSGMGMGLAICQFIIDAVHYAPVRRT